jgi:large subunit ribosomal protein L31
MLYKWLLAEGVVLRYNSRLKFTRVPRSLGMKNDTHPEYHEINVVMTDGTSFTTRSTWGEPGDTMRLDVDPNSHPAWTGGATRLVDSGGQVAKFNKRFEAFGIK